MKKKLFLPLLLVMLLMIGCSSRSGSPYYFIDHFLIEEEGEAFQEAFAALTVDTFRWYQSVEGEDGVYLLHDEFYSQDLLRGWEDNGVYQTVPKTEFFYLAASANYLADQGCPLTAEETEKIRAGVRLYLLPDTMSEEEAAAVQAFLTEDALYKIETEPLIDTAFQRDRKIEFGSYHFEGTFDPIGGKAISDPVIYVASCENMKYFEAESLIATGKEDGYIKLTEEAYQKYAKENLPEELREKQVTFLAVK